ncbi:beta-galactosidase GalA [Mucilaginibacter sp. KACC 22063]|uniref:beta-galactosidase GalA n=1 Tax=Mucilaginibacter sp. KACC 22063 TaxID=3025666 RepID=UPI0023664D73|nr:beta-galactosidase GalA [Mucilaginibacter sp. KACC 22063]WDF57389.1 beta-galactosidase GalA [Mucilaginibacter sp. KACC 22063]
MNRLSLFSLLILVITFKVSSAQSVSERTHQNFDAGWKFHLGHATDFNRDFNYGLGNIFSKSGETAGTALAIDYDEKGWADVTLPHDWAVALPFKYVKNDDLDSHGYKPVGGLFPENSIGWYRKTFQVNRADSGKRFEIQFDGIYRDSKVWINGYYVGGNFSGYNSVKFDITDFIRFGKKNVMVVRADATQSEGWFYEGAGIYRHAWLNTYNNLHFKPQGGVFVHAVVNNNKDAEVTIETSLENRGINAASATVLSYITDRNGKILVTGNELPFSLAVREENKLISKVKLKSTRLWDIDDPYLYKAISLVKVNGRVIDSVQTRFGIRTFTFDSNKGFFLNGRAMKIQGVSCHQDHAGVGSALPDELQYYRIRLLKEMGVNAYRTTHNMPTPELLDACDSLGMLVMDETRLLTSGQEYEQQFRNLILRDRNHASIFLWSIGNEEYATHRTDIGKRIAQNQILLQKELDPSRTCTYAANMGNVFKGVNEVIPVRGFNYNLNGLDGYHAEHPDQPIIGTEVASTVTTRSIFVKDTVRAYVPDYDLTYPSWASTAETWWKITEDRPWFMGGFAWTGFDYRGEPTPYRWPNINSHFGIMDMCGFPKTVYYYYQAWWTDKDVLHIAPHWNWPGKEGRPIDVWVNSNADDVELFLNGKGLGKKTMPRYGHLVWSVKYQPGKLLAVAHKHGKTIKASVETTTAPVSIQLLPSKKVLLDNGEDAVIVNVSVLDKKGREVPDASNLIQFDLQGNADIIGVGNGDPSSHEPDKCETGQWQRHLFGGKAQLIIKAGTKPSEISLTGSAVGLTPRKIVLLQK